MAIVVPMSASQGQLAAVPAVDFAYVTGLKVSPAGAILVTIHSLDILCFLLPRLRHWLAATRTSLVPFGGGFIKLQSNARLR